MLAESLKPFLLLSGDSQLDSYKYQDIFLAKAIVPDLFKSSLLLSEWVSGIVSLCPVTGRCHIYLTVIYFAGFIF